MTLIRLFMFSLSVFFVLYLYTNYKVSKLQKSGLYPQKGKATLADVDNLINANLNIYAIRCYREINPISLYAAKVFVNERAIRIKDSK
jgi:hypothetical protein